MSARARKATASRPALSLVQGGLPRARRCRSTDHRAAEPADIADEPLPPHPNPLPRGVYRVPYRMAHSRHLLVAVTSAGLAEFREVETKGDFEYENAELYEWLDENDPEDEAIASPRPLALVR